MNNPYDGLRYGEVLYGQMIPAANWQWWEYYLTTGDIPPERHRENWQWSYEPRRKASKEAFAEFIKTP